MAQPALDLFKKRGLLMKVEGTEGTDSVPTNTDNGIMLLDGSAGFEFDKVERNIDRPHFTNNPFVVANPRAFIEGMWELIPPATPGAASTSNAPGDILLLSGGFTAVKDAIAQTTRYNPISAAIAAASAYWYQTGTLVKAIGARTALSAIRIAIGERASARVRVMGNNDAMTAVALPAITLPTDVPVVATHANSETNITVDGGSDLLVWAKELSIDLGTTLTSKEYTSHKSNGIQDRLATWTLRIAKTDLADFNPITVRNAASIFTARIRTYNGADPGIYTEIGIRGQIETITKTDIDGDYGWELSGPCIASSAGGDEMYIEFGDDDV